MQRRLDTGEMIGEYRVTGFLGEGGMGVVYRGVHEKLGREAAIKILSSTSQDPSFKSRFLNEARVQAGLHHPNVATLYDFREHGDELVIFMELVDGECLDDLILKRSFTVDQALTVFASICEAIAYIHAHGVIHRDIKAQNAKLTSAGIVKLLDFGIAKDASSHALTQTGGVIGTPYYLSPEQLEGKPGSQQSDIWALGVLLYEMLTGQLPFKGDTLGSLVHLISKGDFPAPDQLNPAVPREAAAIVYKCLKRDTSSRYRTVNEVLADVRKVLTARKSDVDTHDLSTVAIASRNKTVELPQPVANTGGRSSGGSSQPVYYDPAPKEPAYQPTPEKAFPVALVAGLGGGALLLLIIGVIAVYFLASGGDAPAVQTAAATNASPGKGSTKIRVDVDEGKAQVIRGGQLVGTTPIELDANFGDNVPLTLRREGFEDKNVSIQVSPSKKVFTYSLKAK